MPIGSVLVSVFVEQSGEDLAALAMVFPVMLGGAVALWFCGLVAGLPDWLLRRRPRLRPLGAAVAERGRAESSPTRLAVSFFLSAHVLCIFPRGVLS